MSRKKPTNQLDVIGCLDKNTIQSVGEYFASKECNKNYKKLPNEFGVDQSIDAFYLSCLKDYMGFRKEQKRIIAESKNLDIYNAHREEVVCKQHTKLRKQIVKCTKILKELRDKSEAAKVAIANEEEVLKEALGKVALYKIHMNVLKDFKDEFKKTVTDFEIYDHFMKNFIKSVPQYDSSESFINHVDALLMANIDIKDMNCTLEEQLTEMKTDIIQMTRNVASNVMRIKNELDFFQRAFLIVKSEVQELENAFHKCKQICMRKNLEKQMMLVGLNNLYTLLCKRRGINTELRKTDVENICVFIKNEYEVLTGTYNIIRHLEKDYKK